MRVELALSDHEILNARLIKRGHQFIASCHQSSSAGKSPTEALNRLRGVLKRDFLRLRCAHALQYNTVPDLQIAIRNPELVLRNDY